MGRTPRKARKEDHVRLRALNGLLHKALADLLCTPEVSQELCDLNVELSKVAVGHQMGRCVETASGVCLWSLAVVTQVTLSLIKS